MACSLLRVRPSLFFYLSNKKQVEVKDDNFRSISVHFECNSQQIQEKTNYNIHNEGPLMYMLASKR